MRILGIDLGRRTVGIAVSDEAEIIASPIETYRIRENDLQGALSCVKMAIEEYGIQKIVLGLPKNMNGTIGPQAEYCLEFQKMLEEATKLEVVMIDERMTSIMANNLMLDADLSRDKRKQNVDKLAASIILQSYLDKK